MNRFAKRYEEEQTYSEYDKARAAMGNTIRSYPTRTYSFRSVGNTDSFENEYQAFINGLKAKKETEQATVAEEAPVPTDEAPIIDAVVAVPTEKPKKRKSKVAIEETAPVVEETTPTVEETVASDESLFG